MLFRCAKTLAILHHIKIMVRLRPALSHIVPDVRSDTRLSLTVVQKTSLSLRQSVVCEQDGGCSLGVYSCGIECHE